MIRMRVGLITLISAALLTAGAQAAFALPTTTSDSTGATAGAQQSTTPADAAGTTGAQQATACPTPRLKGLPKNPKFTNATIHFTLTGMTSGASYLVRAGAAEVLGRAATGHVVKDQFLLPDQGTLSKKLMITVIVDSQNCDNAPWKLQKAIRYKAVAAPVAPAAPKVPAAPKAPAAPATSHAPVPALTKAPAVKAPKLPKPITELLPQSGPPPSRRAWLTPIDNGSRLDTKLSAPELNRLERKTQKAQSSQALLGLGIVGGLFFLSAIGGFMAFRRRDEASFEKAQVEQLKHLEEGDPGLGYAEDPQAPGIPMEEAPFADEAALGEPAAVGAEGNGATADLNGASTREIDVAPVDLSQHRAEVEAELQRILHEAGLEAELQGVLADARAEAERSGIELDPELMLQALCEEIDGSAKLADTKRAELREMFAGIVAEEAQQAAAHGEKVPTQ